MAKKNARNTRGKIVNAAWQLFYEQAMKIPQWRKS